MTEVVEKVVTVLESLPKSEDEHAGLKAIMAATELGASEALERIESLIMGKRIERRTNTRNSADPSDTKTYWWWRRPSPPDGFMGIYRI
jgi:hypothetical protein